MIIDTHAHIQFDQFKAELPDIFKRASDSGVKKIINVGCDIEKSRMAYEMLKDFDGISGVSLYAALGIHPYDALTLNDVVFPEWKKWIEADDRVVAIGEIGLDYYKSDIPKYKQRDAFKRQLDFAANMKLPVIIHNRQADDDTLEILSDYPDLPAVFHCYGSDLSFAKELWKRNYLTSFTGIITYPNAGELRKVVKECPYDLFMVETDCPFLAPQAFRGKRNEPSFVVEVVKKIAEIKGWEESEIENWQMKNVKRFFGIS